MIGIGSLILSRTPLSPRPLLYLSPLRGDLDMSGRTPVPPQKIILYGDKFLPKQYLCIDKKSKKIELTRFHLSH